MARYEVYATRQDSPGIVSEVIPARGLWFSFPLCAHGEASFTATVPPGGASWRSGLGGVRSGCLIAEVLDNGAAVPVWGGRLKSEDQRPGSREFTFSFQEWGSALDWFPAPVDRWDNVRDTDFMVDVIQRVQAVDGQNLAIGTQGVVAGSTFSDFEVKAWDDITADEKLQEAARAEGGPEWYVTVGGSLKFPQRQFVAGDRLGLTQARTVLEAVEDTGTRRQPPTTPVVALLGSLFPGQAPIVLPGRRGGNVVAVGRSQDSEKAATVIVAIGAGQEEQQIRATAVAQDLLDAGFPRITRTVTFDNVTDPRTLQRHADAELAAVRGLLTDHSLVTLGRKPDWRQVSRGSTVKVSLDTDVYGARRPLEFESRLLNLTVAVPDSGPEQVKWDVREVLQ